MSGRRVRALCSAAAVLSCLAHAAAAPTPPVVQGLDHVPVAVADLERAKADFERLGFVLKPGRPHDDGIRNFHVKFPNHTEIELITAQAPTDALARDYAEWLKGGDGPAYWGLYSPDLRAASARLTALSLKPAAEGGLVTFAHATVPHRFFFGDRLPSPTDLPEHFAHPNTAYRLAAVWLQAGSQERRLLADLGARSAQHKACAPFGAGKEVLALPDGDEIVLVDGMTRSPERALIGVTVEVRSLETARAALRASGVAYTRAPGCEGLWVRPQDAHGLWLEFRN